MQSEVSTLPGLALLSGPPALQPPSAGEQAFLERLLHQVQRSLGCRLVSFCLADEHRHVLKLSTDSSCALAGRCQQCPAAGRVDSLAEGVLAVEDAAGEPGTADERLELGDQVRFYVGVPVRAGDGRRIGRLCLKDGQPRTLSAGERFQVMEHAELIARFLEHCTGVVRQSDRDVLLDSILRSAMEGVSVLRAIRDVAGQIADFEITLVNPAARRILKCEDRAITGRRLRDVFPGTARAGTLGRFREVVELGRPATYEQHYRHDGVDAVLRVTAVPLREDELTLTFSDVTAQQEVEAALRRQAGFQQTLLDTIANPVFYKDRNACYSGCNLAFEELTGRQARDIVGKTVYDIAPSELAVEYDDRDRALLSSGGLQVYEGQVKDAQGRLRDVLFHKATYSDSAGRVAGLVGVITDITSHKQTEEALARRLAYEAGVAACSRALLIDADEDQAIDEALRQLRLGVQASRVRLCTCDAADSDVRRLRVTHENVGSEAAVANAPAAATDYEVCQRRWATLLAAGEQLHGPVAEFPPAERAALEARGVQSVLLLPVRVDGEWHGFIAIEDTETPRRWDPADIRLLQTAAEMVGGYLDQRRAQQELAAELELNSDLALISHAMVSGGTLEHISAHAMKSAQRMTGSPFALVGHMNPRSGELACPAISGPARAACNLETPELVMKQLGGLWAWVTTHGQPLLSNDIRTDPRAAGLPSGHAPIERFLAVPALLHDQVCGVIALANSPRDFTPDDVQSLQRVANLYALAVESTRHREQLNQFSQAIEQSPNMVLFTDAAGAVSYANPCFCAATGYADEEVLGANVFDLLTGDEATALPVADWLHKLRRGVPCHRTFSLPRKRGTPVWVECCLSPICDREGLVVKFVAILQDVTERRRTDEALRESEMRYRLLAENATDLISRHALDGRYIYVSPASRPLFGYWPDELIDQSLFDFVHPDDAEEVRRAHATVTTEAAPVRITCRLRRRDHSYGWFESSTQAIRDPATGAVSELIMVTRDITQRKQTEETLRTRSATLRALNQELEARRSQMEAQKQELVAINHELETARRAAEEANRAKSEFLANMSHEIRTPMTAILGYTRLLSEGQLAPQEQEGYLETISRNGEHLLAIINDILDLSKIEAGKYTVEQLACPLYELVRDVVALMAVRAAEKDLQLDIDYVLPLPARILSDPVRLRQVLMNLVGNAIKFTERGAVTIRVAFERTSEDTSETRIEVIDTGIGMNPAQLERLFQPFSQADSSTTRRFGGTGLGLTISKRLIEMLGGTIHVTSDPGQGSSFVIVLQTGQVTEEELLTELPRDDVADETVPAKPEQLAGRVLLAEDGPDNQRLLKIMLTKAGMSVEVVAQGRAALDAALTANPPFDLILMDMQMPVMDGYEATQRLREAGYHGPIVALTAHAMQGDREKCMAVGCNDYATKPINRDQLLKCCARWLHARPVSVTSAAATDD